MNVHVLAASVSVVLVIAAVQVCVALAIGLVALAVRAFRPTSRFAERSAEVTGS